VGRAARGEGWRGIGVGMAGTRARCYRWALGERGTGAGRYRWVLGAERHWGCGEGSEALGQWQP
jgi:hypothetical protein